MHASMKVHVSVQHLPLVLIIRVTHLAEIVPATFAWYSRAK